MREATVSTIAAEMEVEAETASPVCRPIVASCGSS